MRRMDKLSDVEMVRSELVVEGGMGSEVEVRDMKRRNKRSHNIKHKQTISSDIWSCQGRGMYKCESNAGYHVGTLILDSKCQDRACHRRRPVWKLGS